MDEAVAKGAALLDEKQPGWEDRIDLDTLAMAYPCQCIVGQLYGHYADGVEALELPKGYGEPYGFAIEPSTSDRSGRWMELRDEWVALILGRRAAAS